MRRMNALFKILREVSEKYENCKIIDVNVNDDGSATGIVLLKTTGEIIEHNIV